MTLSPVFRSASAVRFLEEQGVWRRLASDAQAQAEAVRALYDDLRGVIGDEFLADEPRVPAGPEITSPEGLRFLQEFFFLILFRSVFASLGVPETRLGVYTELNFCIKGTITAADNLFDDQAKTLLPLSRETGPRFMSILQLMCFERLLRRVLDRGERAGHLTGEQREAAQKGLLEGMAAIGKLEGSEEGGVAEILEPGDMMEQVHRIRGGALFALAFAAPAVLEEGEVARRLALAEPAIARLGTAFQVVDDLTDFEFDLGRRSHNLLASEIHFHGSTPERAALERYRSGEPIPEGVVEGTFQSAARAVLERAYQEGRASFQELATLGYWFPPDLADHVVRAIVGLDGVARMEAIASGAMRS